MKFEEALRNITTKLLDYKPLLEIYDKKNHFFPLKDIEMYSEFETFDWDKILLNYRTVLEGLYVYIANDDYLNNYESLINDEIFDLREKYLNISPGFLDPNAKEQLLKTLLLLNLYACCVVQQGNPKRIMSDGSLDTKKTELTMYRGEDDYLYPLLPSIYRGMEVDRLKTFSFFELHSFYYSKNLIHKYRDYCEKTEVDYDFCSLMQHAGCKSPFLDLTSDSRIALSFASSGEMNKDGALYVFNGLKRNRRENMRNISVVITNRKLDLMTIVRRTPILLCNVYNFDVSMTLFQKQTNDRMVFQKGAFLYINKCIIVRGRLLLPITNKRIKKYRITKKMKTYFSNLFNKEGYKRYNARFLMDPYSYFID